MWKNRYGSWLSWHMHSSHFLEHIAVSAWHWWRMVMERAFYLQNPRLLSCKKEMKRERGIIPCQTMNINKKAT